VMLMRTKDIAKYNKGMWKAPWFRVDLGR